MPQFAIVMGRFFVRRLLARLMIVHYPKSKRMRRRSPGNPRNGGQPPHLLAARGLGSAIQDPRPRLAKSPALPALCANCPHYAQTIPRLCPQTARHRARLLDQYDPGEAIGQSRHAYLRSSDSQTEAIAPIKASRYCSRPAREIVRFPVRAARRASA